MEIRAKASKRYGRETYFTINPYQWISRGIAFTHVEGGGFASVLQLGDDK
jgi:hypothetical protein